MASKPIYYITFIPASSWLVLRFYNYPISHWLMLAPNSARTKTGHTDKHSPTQFAKPFLRKWVALHIKWPLSMKPGSELNQFVRIPPANPDLYTIYWCRHGWRDQARDSWRHLVPYPLFIRDDTPRGPTCCIAPAWGILHSRGWPNIVLRFSCWNLPREQAVKLYSLPSVPISLSLERTFSSTASRHNCIICLSCPHPAHSSFTDLAQQWQLRGWSSTGTVTHSTINPFPRHLGAAGFGHRGAMFQQ